MSRRLRTFFESTKNVCRYYRGGVSKSGNVRRKDSMKIITTIVCCLFALVLSVGAQDKPMAQNRPAQASGADAKINPEKEAHIRRLLELSGAKDLASQIMGEMSKNMKPMVTNSLPAGEYREQLVDLFFERFKKKADTQQLIEMGVPVYDKYFSDEEIVGLIKFYETPLGQKALSTVPKLMGELQQVGGSWGQKLGRDSMTEVLDEHPDLRAALEEAAKKAQGR
jgi:uncharacterized protein